MRGAKSLTTIFDLEAVNNNDLPESLNDAHKAAMLARYAVEGLMMKAEHSIIDSADLNLIQEILYTAEAHAWHAQTLHEKATETLPAVHPPLGEPVTYGERGADCPVCGAAILHHNAERGRGGAFDEAEATCSRCEARMHEPCYWGRVVTLSEFQEYRRQIAGGPENYGAVVVCAQCRAKGESA